MAEPAGGWAAYEGKTGVDPKTGQRYIVKGGQPIPITAESSRAGRLTEDQGKAVGYASLMSNAEDSYQKALAEGYDPGDFRNSLGAVLEGLPFGGLDGLGALVRDDVGDKGRQAEMQFSDAQLKAMSGAAAPESEVKRNIKILFPRPFENVKAAGPQKRGARETAYGASRTRAGPGATAVKPFPEVFMGKRLSPAEAAKLPPGTPFIGLDGKKRVRQ